MEIKKIISAETELEKKIISDQRFIEGCEYGKPRRGHPEGKVIYHIKDVLENINQFSDYSTREDLRLVGLIHDTFKYKVDKTKARTEDNHHGAIARKFAEEYIKTTRVLDTIQFHDEAYNCWVMGNRNGRWISAEKRALELVGKLGENVNFYLVFYKCDNLTGDKNVDNFLWFHNFICSQNLGIITNL